MPINADYLADLYDLLDAENDYWKSKVHSAPNLDDIMETCNFLTRSQHELIELMLLSQRIQPGSSEKVSNRISSLLGMYKDLQYMKVILNHDDELKDKPEGELGLLLGKRLGALVEDIQASQVNKRISPLRQDLNKFLSQMETIEQSEQDRAIQRLKKRLESLASGSGLAADPSLWQQLRGRQRFTDATLRQIESGKYLTKARGLIAEITKVEKKDISLEEKYEQVYLALKGSQQEKPKAQARARAEVVSSPALEAFIDHSIKEMEKANPDLKGEYDFKETLKGFNEFLPLKDILRQPFGKDKKSLLKVLDEINKREGNFKEKRQNLIEVLQAINSDPKVAKEKKKIVRNWLAKIEKSFQNLAQDVVQVEGRPDKKPSLMQRMFSSSANLKKEVAEPERVAPGLIAQLKALVSGKGEKKLSEAKTKQIQSGSYLKMAQALLKKLIDYVKRKLKPSEENKRVYFSLNEARASIARSRFKPSQFKDEFTSPALEQLIDSNINKLNNLNPFLEYEHKLEGLAKKYKHFNLKEGESKGALDSAINFINNPVEEEGKVKVTCLDRCNMLKAALEGISKDSNTPKGYKDAIKPDLQDLSIMVKDLNKLAKAQAAPSPNEPHPDNPKPALRS